jgi:hypothetical protein
MEFLTSLLASIIRPIIREELDKFKDWAKEEFIQNKKFKEFDSVAMENIKAMESATTPEEVKAHARRIYQERARLNL